MTTPTASSPGERPHPGVAGLSPLLVELLADAQRIGAIGPAPLEQHLDHSLGFARALADLLPPSPRIVDLGSGGGIPGLVLAEVFPEAHLTLLEGRTMRAERLLACVAELGWESRVAVIAARAEDVGHESAWRFHFDSAVARGFAAPPVTAECAAPLLVDGGLLCVSEPPGAAPFSRWPEAGCAEVGLSRVRALEAPHAFVVLRRSGPCAERYPRRVGVPQRRPLF